MILPSLVGAPATEVMVGLASAVPPGNFAEVGVYQGGSAQVLYGIAKAQGRELHLFDTFTGMPEASGDDNHPVGAFPDGDLAGVMAAMPDAHVHIGIFPGTMVDCGPVAFVHADADQYQTTMAIIETFSLVMVPNGIILFDDYECTRGTTRAVDESFSFDRIKRTPQGKAWVQF
jgi:O-methyltransferase